jgi:beta-glucanase (GH16 family)
MPDGSRRTDSGAPFRTFGFIALLAGATLAAVPVRQAASSSTVIFADEFAAPALDRTKWNVEVTGRTVNNEQQAYIDSTDTVDIVNGADAEGADGGALRIRPRWRPGFTTAQGRTFDLTSGRLNTAGKVEFTYGTASARIKLTAGQGLWPAFWALGAGRWPDTGEMDIMENVGEADWTNVALHGPGYSGDTPLATRHHFTAPDDITNWHVYTMDWTPDRLVFSIDGETFYDVTKTMVEKYGRWAYDNPKHLIVNFALGGQYPQAVNHATQPYPGLPAATVDLIKADRVQMLVDWVRVNQASGIRH